MFIDNTPTSAKWTVAMTLTLAIPVSLLIYTGIEYSASSILFYQVGNNAYINSTAITLNIFAYLGLIAHVIILWLNPAFIYFNDEGKKIILRTCTSYPIFRKYREYPFPKSSLTKFQVEETMFGYRKNLSLTVTGKDPNTGKNKEVVIDNISLSALKKETIEELTTALNKAIRH